MIETTTDRRNISSDTLEKLRSTVIDLFSKGLFHKVGIREIAKQAQVGPQTIYKYFGNKDQLIFACIRPELARLNETLKHTSDDTPGTALDTLKALISTFVGYYLRNRRLAEIVYMTIPARQWVIDPEFAQHETLSYFAQALKQGQTEGSIRTDANPEELLDLMAGAFGRYITRKITNPEPINIDAECAHLYALAEPMFVAPPVAPIAEPSNPSPN
ncbi:MAG: TetR/AcrR family transcriptional regulator [Cellvibrionaceae bacterium]